MASCTFPVLDPQGPVGADEKSVIIIAFALMLIVVIPVFVMTFLFAWRYRATNENATYAPKWSHSGKIEAVVWTVPILIVISLGYLSWKTTHELNPYRPLVSTHKAIRVDAVALNWKWLFIYPDLHIASVNQLVFPANVPVSFRLTSDTVMSSFFIPSLGSQIYAMPGMQTQLNLMADHDGTFDGRNFQFSGRGYSSMHFKAIATTPQKFAAWVQAAQKSATQLDPATLKQLEKPSTHNPVSYYSAVKSDLFDQIIHRFTIAKVMKPVSATRNGA